MFAVYAESFSSDDPLSGLVVGERPDPDVPDGWTTVTVKAASLNHHDLWSLKGVGPQGGRAPDDPRLRRRRARRGRQPGRGARRDQRPVVARGRDLRPEAVAAQRALPGHLRRQGRRAQGQRRTQARVPLLRGGRVPADGVADGVPDALHPGRPQGRRQRARAGRRRRRRHRADHAGARRRAEGVRHQPRRGQAQARPRDRRPRGRRDRRAAAAEGRRRDGDRRSRDLVALDPGAASRRQPSSSPVRRPARSSTTPS